ncbi:peptidoglycan N-acetylmuramoylhydrolase [Malaciobacter molluscorum LMG 25693]|uniref:peptidoglycan lytic exotransglycosylase n=1 Tax=Malaciobacter molluscorum LMG 25693 TaxID=870501 RepID=A0A2G1DEQ8_9BACT|nr:murein transglycosylase A [Malaciobacter molluscorum]AXX93516.1 membrane-bound lytic murein transglycosylase A [Malaciobacter molluscorum LMG 25693]PHO16977.1 peptidoglycan N-acetylmuramoylhydrolase [Malaciobacter molluscorum LMG 25693]
MKYLIIFLVPIFLFTGCAIKEYEKYDNISKASLEKVNFYDIENFYNDDFDFALKTFQKACKKSKRFSLFEDVCEESLKAKNGRDFFISNFQPYKLIDKNGKDEGIITGYYEPLLNGSLTKDEKYKYPIYKTPKDMVMVDLSSIYPELKKYRLRGKLEGNKVVPYDSRAVLDKKDNQNLEPICYVDDKFELFLLHIQGSGKVKLTNGDIINVGYANQNGRRYTSVGKYMLKKGYLKPNNASIQGMKAFFDKNPDKVDDILNHNESYVFFRKANQGATGALGVELTAKRNLAVDRNYIPLGMPVFLSTSNPITKEQINKLMVAADTGGAIKGEIRADFFWGYGDKAFKYAGKMKEKGTLYILIPKDQLMD